ncbi:hypothetical protein LPJ61_000784 [Coemansia biformis]|uniref:Uncharacterized protein n=1 Tax=Coemansia biformis TaxID=1286918 RepID=A0A9W7YGF4_9FUNG|nr:hypothetical protein LPJ61_000784 [Coemansia biformis]
MGYVRDYLQVLFRRGGSAQAAAEASARDDKRGQSSPGRRLRGASPADAEPPLPYHGHEVYSCKARQCLNAGAALIFKTFYSDAPSPLDDKGIGRLKAVYEAWLPKGSAVPSDRISGIYMLAFIGSGACDSTISCGGTTTTRAMTKHRVQCLYTGAGLRHGATVHGDTPCAGLVVWIKGSLPVGGPWVQAMAVPPEARLNKLCAIAAPKPDFAQRCNRGDALLELPDLTAHPSGHVFEIDSDVYVYTCRLSPCASIRYTAASAARSTSEPPICEPPRLLRAATVTATSHTSAGAARGRGRSRRHSPVPSNRRSIFIHVFSDLSKNGRPRSGGARLVLPGGVHLSNGAAAHLKNVTPGAEIAIRSAGFDRAQFVLVDMPTYRDGDGDDGDDDASDSRSI